MIPDNPPIAASKIFCDRKQHIITFCQDQLSIMQPRDDYRELLKLTIIIYGIEMFLFRNQFFKSSPLKILANSRVTFVILSYLEHWYTARSAIIAPNNDLQFLRLLVVFPDSGISKAIRKKYSQIIFGT